MDFPAIILPAAIIISFYASLMGGGNDFANAFGTSVGSKAITFRQAVLIAIFAELIGAVLVGGHVTDTVRKGILVATDFEDAQLKLVLGLMAALLGSGVLLQAATRFGLPVSTTHAIVGAVVGFGLIGSGIDSVRWANVGAIAISWVLSPIGGGLVAFIIFRVIQRTILETKFPLKASIRVIPYFVGLTTSVVILALIYKGLKNLHLDLPLTSAVILALICGVIAAFATRFWSRGAVEEKPRRVQLVFVESRFKYLQIFTAGYVAFAHGANDVANSVGPLAGIYTIIRSGTVGMEAEVPIWILILGGVGIVLGLALFGRRVIETIGTKITLITPSRGFSAEFAAATVVLLFSKLGMPVSTTHTLVGAVIGVGFARGIDAIDMRVVGRIFTSWIVTLPAAALVTVLTYLVLAHFYL